MTHAITTEDRAFSLNLVNEVAEVLFETSNDSLKWDTLVAAEREVWRDIAKVVLNRIKGSGAEIVSTWTGVAVHRQAIDIVARYMIIAVQE